VFVHIEPNTFNADPREISSKRTPRTKAALVVDVFGHPADWNAIGATAEGLVLIEDSCEAIGATYRGRPAGSFSAAGCFAFYPNKQITTGEGGMIVTDDAELATRCRSLRNQGRDSMSAWLEHERLGFNYRMNEMSAALGVSQLKRLPQILERRAAVAAAYDQRLASFRLAANPGRASRRHDELVRLCHHARTRDRSRRTHRKARRMLPITEDVAKRTLALPFHTNLDLQSIERTVAALAAS
jgi:perosamine synthetase